MGDAPDYTRTDDRSENVDVKLLYQQKSALLRAIDNCKSDEDIQLLEGLINYCDYQGDHLDPDGSIWEAIGEEIIKISDELKEVKKGDELVFGFTRLDVLGHLGTLRDQGIVPEEFDNDDELVAVVSNMDRSWFYEQMEADINGHISDHEGSN